MMVALPTHRLPKYCAATRGRYIFKKTNKKIKKIKLSFCPFHCFFCSLKMFKAYS